MKGLPSSVMCFIPILLQEWVFKSHTGLAMLSVTFWEHYRIAGVVARYSIFVQWKIKTFHILISEFWYAT